MMDEDVNYRAIAQLNRAYMGAVWRMLRDDPDSLSDEERLLADQMLAHTEYHDVWDRIEEIGDHMFDPTREQNPFLHVSIHVALDRQIRSGDPPCATQTLERLVEQGMDPHEAQHAMLRVLVQEMWRVLTDRQPFNLQRYRQSLEEL